MNDMSAEQKTQILIDHFGLSTSAKDVGFILPDGRMLNLQRWYPDRRRNHVDAVSVIYGRPPSGKQWNEVDLIALMAELRLLRFCLKGEIHAANPPTRSQIRKLYSLVAYRSNVFEVLISNAQGITMARSELVSPTMEKILNVFKIYSDNMVHLSEDEFGIEDREGHYSLVFRPNHQTVGRYLKNSGVVEMNPLFDQAKPLFMKLLEYYLK
ncbi:hypothetical protein K6Y31_20050 [Motilimonas cestriensis]|uniref:Uncharacterized protein n=1 Tax=Motilimonas cestriensis TaxID=2742685 RepID=A0ABS8WHG5_9GAMM|nr:hypothetical protein [Motilimonas cestriensis]MCE2597071.1 hypothetical protein [Motilimonas cestriensis]